MRTVADRACGYASANAASGKVITRFEATALNRKSALFAGHNGAEN